MTVAQVNSVDKMHLLLFQWEIFRAFDSIAVHISSLVVISDFQTASYPHCTGRFEARTLACISTWNVDITKNILQ